MTHKEKQRIKTNKLTKKKNAEALILVTFIHYLPLPFQKTTNKQNNLTDRETLFTRIVFHFFNKIFPKKGKDAKLVFIIE